MNQRLKHITFTGIDSRTDATLLVKIQKEFPIAEFGILTSYHWYENGNRYLDPRLIRKFLGKGLNLSLHICGSAAHDAALGDYGDIRHLTYGTYGYIPRIQLNISERKDNPKVVSSTPYGHEIIIQQRDINNLELFSSTQEKWREYCGSLSILLDASGGRGIDTPLTVLPLTNKVGYAGGFNPDNVSEKLSYLLANHTTGNFWIDMESGVRTDDWFDLDKVVDVLKKCSKCLDNE